MSQVKFQEYAPKTEDGRKAKQRLGAQVCLHCGKGYATDVVLVRDGEHMDGAHFMGRALLIQKGFSVFGYVHVDDRRCDKALLRGKPKGIQRQIVFKPSEAYEDFLAVLEEEKNISDIWVKKIRGPSPAKHNAAPKAKAADAVNDVAAPSAQTASEIDLPLDDGASLSDNTDNDVAAEDGASDDSESAAKTAPAPKKEKSSWLQGLSALAAVAGK